MNKIFLNNEHWSTLPPKTPEHIKEAWLGQSYGARLSGKHATVNGKRRDSEDARRMRIEIARLSAFVEALNSQISDLQSQLKLRTKQLEQPLQKRIRKGPCPLSLATDAFFAHISRKIRGRQAIQPVRLLSTNQTAPKKIFILKALKLSLPEELLQPRICFEISVKGDESPFKAFI